ncbi:MAG: hypothetical protein NT154_22225 [Verrucomicrobia bacterium]|nr:hypothetical protein [Verrucomicrobiota bacterium]
MLNSSSEPVCAFYRLSGLLQSKVLRTLGEIVFALKADSKALRCRHLRTRVAESYDEYFGSRPDFAIWRREFGKKNPTSASKGFPPTEELLETGLSHHEPAVVWGVLTMADGLATSARGARLFNGDHEYLVSLMERAAFLSRLGPLSNAHAGCAVHRLLTLGAINKVRFEASHLPLPLDQLIEYVDTVERLIGEIDRSWHPGRSVSFAALNQEPTERPVGALCIFELKLRLDSFIFCVRGTVRDGVKRLDMRQPEVRRLLLRAAQFAFSSWRCARSSRVFIEGRVERLRNCCKRTTGLVGNTVEELVHARKNECRALIRASQAAKDAGFLSSSAKLAFWALRTIPDEFVQDREFLKFANGCGHDIRQFGLEPDQRFPWERISRFAKEAETPGNNDEVGANHLDEVKDANPAIGLSALSGESANPAKEDSELDTPSPVWSTIPQEVTSGVTDRRSRRVLDPNNATDPFKARIAADQEDSPDWQTVLRKYRAKPENPMDPIGKAIYDANGGRLNDPALANAAFNLCAYKYKLPAAAASLIEHFKPSKSDVMALVTQIEYATREIPLGIDQDAQRTWQKTLRSVWRKLPAAERVYEEDVLLAHEVLLGRGVTLFRASRHSTSFAQRFFGELDDEKARELLDCDFSLLNPAKTGINPTELRSRVEEFTRGLSDQVVLGSLVSLTPTEWSLLMVGGDRRWHWDRISFESDLLQEAASILSVKGWGAPGFTLPWQDYPGLRGLAQALGDAVKTNYPSVSYLELAVEPRLARLPWNELLKPIWGRLGIRPLVALIPNLTWPLVAQAKHYSPDVKLFVADENALTGHLSETPNQAAERSLFMAAGEQLRETKPLLERNYRSAAFVLGQGAWDQAGKMTVILAPSAPIELADEAQTDLLDLGQYRVVVAYACHGGHVAQHFLGDLGGIPGVCLSLRTRLFVGPPAEISLKIAAALHKHLADPNGPPEIGLRYLAAIKEEPSVAHFNLFGFANESVLGKSAWH